MLTRFGTQPWVASGDRQTLLDMLGFLRRLGNTSTPLKRKLLDKTYFPKPFTKIEKVVAAHDGNYDVSLILVAVSGRSVWRNGGATAARR